MFPHERSLVKELETRPFALIGVNSDASREKLKNARTKHELTFRSFYDGPTTFGPIAGAWNVTVWPTIYVLDAKGVIRHRDLHGDALTNAIRALVAEAEKEAVPSSK